MSFMFLIRFVPKSLLSYLVGAFVHIPLPQPLATWSTTWFAQRYRINMDEAEHPIEHYQSIGSLFTRKLKPGLRPIAASRIVHPADAVITSNGEIRDGLLLQAKGRKYAVNDFLYGQGPVASLAIPQLEGGTFLTYYLCPTDYHRVHSPIDGHIIAATHVPGYLWPVNAWSVANIEQLFAVNERVSVWIQTEKSTVALVMVGATNVGKMTMSFDPDIVTNTWGQDSVIVEKKYAQPIAIAKGDEIGVFNMGSTVVMLYPKELVSNWSQNEDLKTKIGESLL